MYSLAVRQRVAAVARPVDAFGQQTLFGEPPRRPVAAVRFTVSVFGQRRPWSTSLPLIVAQARAASLRGHRAVVMATDGAAVEVRHQADGFLVTAVPASALPPWADHARRLLVEHG
jgi:hypothetical protein